MSKVFFKLNTGNFLQNWSNTGLINALNDWSGVESIVGYRGDDLFGTVSKDPRTITGEGTVVVNVLHNSANPNTLATGGVAEFAIADPVVALQGSSTADAPNLVLYLDATGRENLKFSVDLRDIDGSADNSIQPIAIQYRIGDSGPWITLDGGYVADASSGPSLATMVTHLDVTLPATVNNQGQVEIRIITVDAAGSDEWIGIDNISVTSSALVVVADTTAPVVISSSPIDGATMVPVASNLALNFSEQVNLGSGTITISDNAGDTRTIAIGDSSQVTLSGQTLTINPAADLKPGSTYQVSLSAGAVVDKSGNPFSDSDANPVEFTTTPPVTPIYTIQGASHTSPLNGQTVFTQGVVTAIDTSGTKGFWIQDANGDGNSATSDAVFVASTNTAAVKVGNLVQLMGTVQEVVTGVANNLSITQLSGVQNLAVLSTGNVITPTVLGTGGRVVPNAVVDSDHFGAFNPDGDAVDFYESLEGMLLTMKDVQIVGKGATNVSFGVTNSGANATGINDRGAITRSEGDVNPERVEIFNDTGVLTGGAANFNVGDKAGDITGVLSYYNGFYEVLPTVVPGAVQHATITRDTTSLVGDSTHLTVGAYNVDNLAATSPASKITQLAADIANNMHAPDMLGLEEVQDNNGSGSGMLASDLTVTALIDAIKAAGGPQYSFVVIDPTAENTTGGATNGNIRNVILYNADRVSFVADSARLLVDNNLANGDAFASARKPLAADFLFRGETVTFVSIHNTDRTGSDEPFGHNQPGVEGGDARRNDQTEAVQQFVQQQLQANPDARIVVAGDFNGLHFETSLTQLEANGALTNLVRSLPASDRYTSSNEGNNEQLDHVLVSGKLATGAEFDNVHLNTNLSTTTGSDRDPVLARVFVNSAPVSNGDSPNAALEDGTLVVDAAQGVLANDNDINRDNLTAVLQQGPAHGTLVLAADGSFTYTPFANYNGSDSFSYLAKDAFGGESAVATVQLTVSAVNDDPTLVASAPSAVLMEEGIDRTGAFSSLVTLQLADVDSAMSYDTSDWTFEAEGIYTREGTYGLAILDTANNVVYYLLDNRLPATEQLAEGASATDDFSVIITDGITTASVPLSFEIIGSNDAPYTRASSASLPEDGSVVGTLLRNAIDPDGDAVSAEVQEGPAHGSVVLAANGSYTYTPVANFNGSDSFTFVVKDPHGGVSQLARVTLTVDAVNDAPTLSAAAPSAVLVEAGSGGAGVASSLVALQVADIDSTVSYDLAGWTLASAGVYSRAGTYGTATLDTVANTVQYTLDNTLAATNALGFDAHVTDNFNITVTDGSASASTPLSFAINGSNDTPTALADSASVLEDGIVTVNVLGNDGDVDGDALSITLVTAKSDLGATISVVNGQVSYTADADSFDLLATGQSAVDHFSYTVSDGHGGVSSPIAVTVAVREANDSVVLAGGNGDDTFVDAVGRDTTYSGGNGDDAISGGDGADVLSGGTGHDSINGGDGIDVLNGDNGNDKLFGGDGADSLFGDNGDDVLSGGNGSDALNGGTGNDLAFGGAGDDTMAGGNGNDRFIFSLNAGRDVIVDFRAGEDKIVLGYAGNGSAADLASWAAASHPVPGLAFANLDLDGNGHADAVAITGASLGDGTIVLMNWTVADLIGQHLITANNQVIGSWIA